MAFLLRRSAGCRHVFAVRLHRHVGEGLPALDLLAHRPRRRLHAEHGTVVPVVELLPRSWVSFARRSGSNSRPTATTSRSPAALTRDDDTSGAARPWAPRRRLARGMSV